MEAALEDTIGFWKDWADRAADTGSYDGVVRRALMVLKPDLRATGGVVAAPTTSLPEDRGREIGTIVTVGCGTPPSRSWHR